MSAFAVACLQTNSSDDMAANVATALGLAEQAVEAGADLILMPENVSMMTWGTEAIIAAARPPEAHPALAAFRDFARKRQVWLHVITSYSIHYTKLYDATASAGVRSARCTRPSRAGRRTAAAGRRNRR